MAVFVLKRDVKLQPTNHLTKVTRNKPVIYSHIIYRLLKYIEQSLQPLSDCFGLDIKEDLELVKERKSVSFGKAWFHIGRIW